MPMTYTPQLLDHFEHPRNVGEAKNPSARAQVENPICGDLLTLTLRVEEGRISEVRYRARGCVASIAAGSALTELLHGQPLDAARALQREQLVAALGGLSNETMHASHLAMDALTQALRQL
jgi:nitrogen fixation NifU-like protein